MEKTNDNEKDLNNTFLSEEKMKLIQAKDDEEKESKNSLINILHNLAHIMVNCKNLLYIATYKYIFATVQ